MIMEKLIGGEYEKSLLTNYLQSGQSEFIAIRNQGCREMRFPMRWKFLPAEL